MELVIAKLPAAGVVTLIAVAVVVVVIATYLITVAYILVVVNRRLVTILGAIHGVADRSAPVGEKIDAINADLAATQQSLERLLRRDQLDDRVGSGERPGNY